MERKVLKTDDCQRIQVILRGNKYLALNVANTKQYKTFEEDTVSLAKDVGFEHTDTWWLSLSTQQGGSLYLQ